MNRELMIAVEVLEGDDTQKDVVATVWDEHRGSSSIVQYIDMKYLDVYVNGAKFYLNKGKPNEIGFVTDLYVDDVGSVWVSARVLNNFYELNEYRGKELELKPPGVH